jgi:nucleoid-associated protein YgaU
MALNVKAAMFICVGFIGGLTWLAQEVAGPPVDRATPVLVASAPVQFAQASFAPPAVDVNRRTDWARQFVRPNPVDRAAAERAPESPSVELLAPDSPPARDYAALLLPPLAEPDVPEALPLAAAEPEMEFRLVAQAAPPPVAEAPRMYRVERGDTLATIARREWGSRDARLVDLLLDANPQIGYRKAGRIILGEELVIPDADAAERFLAGKPWRPGAPAAASESVRAAEISGAAPATEADEWYTIRPNDTLAGIATRFLNDSRRWREIVEVNRALNPQKMVPGTRIRLPVVAMARG